MIDLIVIGAGENGQMVVSIVDEINDLKKKINIVGFLDDDPKKSGKSFLGVPVVGSINDYKNFKTCFFTSPLITSPKTNINKSITVNKLDIEQKNYLNIIHPGIKTKYISLGVGNLITENTIIHQNSKIGNHCYISSNVVISPEIIIEDFVSISNSSSLQGKCMIKEGAYIGANSSIMGAKTIGKWTIIGMGAVVLKDVADYQIVAGNPAKNIGNNDKAIRQLKK